VQRRLPERHLRTVRWGAHGLRPAGGRLQEHPERQQALRQVLQRRESPLAFVSHPQCAVGSNCVYGVCSGGNTGCPPGQVRCSANEACVNQQNDNRHCGKCFNKVSLGASSSVV
jgi:hypothetical protein